ncbi:MAG TPA: TetR/AcrR family transcriptional regulator [Acidimicrobiales bacterium]|nr:TetR/AcrR family transcriptional regulator [Acidimicrobiales bacterium]
MARRRLTREENKAKTRQELLRAANRLFLRNGYVATSLANIAEEAGLTKGAVYSNFESKEDLFLALLQEPEPEWTGPHDVAGVTGTDTPDKARSFGRYAASQIPSPRHLALFFEMNAAALRSERARKWVATHNDGFFEQLGERLRDALAMPDADARTLGFIAQSLYVGLVMHSGYADDSDDELFATAYGMLAALARSE